MNIYYDGPIYSDLCTWVVNIPYAISSEKLSISILWQEDLQHNYQKWDKVKD